MEDTEVSATATARGVVAPMNPVLVTLTCAWCGREVADVEGRMVGAGGRLVINPASDHFRILAGRPVCLDCGGPLVIENWRSQRRVAATPIEKSEPPRAA